PRAFDGTEGVVGSSPTEGLSCWFGVDVAPHPAYSERSTRCRTGSPRRCLATFCAASRAAWVSVPPVLPELCGEPRTFGSSKNGRRVANGVPCSGSCHHTSRPAENDGVR